MMTLIQELVGSMSPMMMASVGAALFIPVMFVAYEILGRYISFAIDVPYKGNMVIRILCSLFGEKWVGYSDGHTRTTNNDCRRGEEAEWMIPLSAICIFVLSWAVYWALFFWKIVSVIAIIIAVTLLSRFCVRLGRKMQKHIDTKDAHSGK